MDRSGGCCADGHRGGGSGTAETRSCKDAMQGAEIYTHIFPFRKLLIENDMQAQEVTQKKRNAVFSALR
jgi:hypothetical protein